MINPYQSPDDAADSGAARTAKNIAHAHSAFRKAIRLGLAQQGTVVLIAALLLDGGQFLYQCLWAVVAFWVLVVIGRLTSTVFTSHLYVVYVRYGFLPVLVTVAALRRQTIP